MEGGLLDCLRFLGTADDMQFRDMATQENSDISPILVK